MRKIAFLFCCALLFAGCQRMNIGPKGAGEYVVASASVPYEEISRGALKKKVLKQAEINALEKATRVFLSSNSTVEFPQEVKKQIIDNPSGYIRRSYITSAYRRGETFYAEARVMILVSDLAAKIKELESADYVKKTNIFVASRELIENEVSLKQYCRQGIYKALKDYPYLLIDGGNLSQNNLENYNQIVDKAKKEGARYIILADASAEELGSAAQLTTSFKPVRAKANIQVIAASNYQVIAESSEGFSGLDGVLSIAQQKALTGACENAALQIAEPVNLAIHSAKTFKFIINDVNSIERLEELQNIMRQLREVEDFALVKYTNSNATFEVQANIRNSEEFAAQILRKYYANFTVERTTPDLVEMTFK